MLAELIDFDRGVLFVNLRVGQNKKPLEEGEKVRVQEGSRNWILDITIIKSIKTDREWGKKKLSQLCWSTKPIYSL